MTTSGTFDQVHFDVRRVIDRAVSMCRVPMENVTSEIVDTAIQNLNLILRTLILRKVSLWCIEKRVLGLYQAQNFILMPLATETLKSCNLRITNRLAGIEASSAGGVVDLAFDNDFNTKLDQTTPNGNVQVTFTSPTAIDTVGFFAGFTGSITPVFEASNDGVTWDEIYAAPATPVEDKKWAWFDMPSSLPYANFRMRETGGATLSIRELYWGAFQTEIPMTKMNHDDYSSLPNKNMQGRPVQYWYDRQRVYPVMRLWPSPDAISRYYQMVAWRVRRPEDVLNMTETIDIPVRWDAAIISMLAARMAKEEVLKVSPDLASKIQVDANMDYNAALAEERDISPVNVYVDIAPYTR